MSWEHDMDERAAHLCDVQIEAAFAAYDAQLIAWRWNAANGYILSTETRTAAILVQRMDAERSARARAAVDAWCIADTRCNALQECNRRYFAMRSEIADCTEEIMQHVAAAEDLDLRGDGT